MGSRRVSRKRLYNVEKAGISVDLESAVGIKDCVVSATQHRQGQEIITEIALDLNPSAKDGLILGGGTNEKAIGLSGAEAYITQLSSAKYGIITEIRGVVVEAPVGGDTVVKLKTDVYNAIRSQGGVAVASSAVDELDVIGKDTSKLYDAQTDLVQQTAGQEHFLYITNKTGNANAMSSGKILIYIHGFEAPADV